MTDTFFSSSEKRAMGTVLLMLVWPDTTDSLVTDSLPSELLLCLWSPVWSEVGGGGYDGGERGLCGWLALPFIA